MIHAQLQQALVSKRQHAKTYDIIELVQPGLDKSRTYLVVRVAEKTPPAACIKRYGGDAETIDC